MTEQLTTARPPNWASRLFETPLAPVILDERGVLVWTAAGDKSTAAISEQFRSDAGTYHRKYAATTHFLALFEQAFAATEISIPDHPRILDFGSGSGANSILPCQKLFPEAQFIATDLSPELLAMLAHQLRCNDSQKDVLCVVMDAMSNHVAKAAFDLVTGTAILHHLDRPLDGLRAASEALKPGGHAIFFEPFNGWAIMRLAYERILAEAELRKEALDVVVTDVMRAMITDIAMRSLPQPDPVKLAILDDKWLFSRTRMEKMARSAGFASVQFVPHNDHPTLYRDAALVHLRLATGDDNPKLPEWVDAILANFDDALTLQAKRELMLEGTVVLSKL